MLPSIIAFIVVLIFFIYIAFLFLKDIVVALVNVGILYILGIRIYTEIKKYHRGEIYAYCGVISVILALFFGTLWPLWRITSAVILAFLLVHLVVWSKKERKKENKITALNFFLCS